MRSPTQPQLSVADVDAIVRRGLGSPAVDAAELSGGGFAAVWRATLTDGRDVVVKVGPPPEARLLRYEHGLVAAEAAYFRLTAPLAPVPVVLAQRDGWLITSLLPGRPLIEVEDDGPVREQLGAVVRRIHQVTGPHFGYTGGRASGADWPSAFRAIIDDLLADAAAWRVPVPRLALPYAVLRPVTRPALLHFDLWDGNVLAAGGRLTGLVDGERHLYGDPLLDLVSPALFRRIEDEPDHPFLRGYPVDLDDAARARLTMYRVHLYLLMLVERPSRGAPVGGERHELLAGLLSDELRRLAT